MAETNFENFLSSSNHRGTMRHEFGARQQHEQGLKHHASMARIHKDAMDASDEGSTAHNFHKASMQSHTEAGEFHSSGLATLKSAGFADLGKGEREMEPTRVSAIAVPRYGAPPIAGSTDVPEMFRKMIAVGDE